MAAKTASDDDIPNRHVTLGRAVYDLGQEEIAKFKAQVEELYTWIDETLASIRQQMSTSEVQLLPKTPSSKRAMQALRKKSKREEMEEDDDETEDQEPLKKKVRRKKGSRRKPSKNETLEAQEDSADDFEDSSSARSTRSTRATRSTRSTRSTTASRSTRGSRKPQQQQPAADDNTKSSTPRSSEPVLCLQATAIQEQPEKEKDNKDGKPEVILLDSESDIESARPKAKRQRSTPAESPVKKANTQALKPGGTNKNSPKSIPGFRHLSVKDKAQAFQKLVHSPVPIVNNANNASQSTQQQVLDTPPKSPMDEDEATDLVENELSHQSSQQSSRRQSSRRSSHRLSTRLNLSHRRSSVNHHKIRTSIRLSSVKCKPSVAASSKAPPVTHSPNKIVANQKLNSPSFAQPTESYRSKMREKSPAAAPMRTTRSKVRLNKPPPPSLSSPATASPVPPPRKTRSKMRPQQQPPQQLQAPDTDEEEEQEQPSTTRTTRSKMRQTKEAEKRVGDDRNTPPPSKKPHLSHDTDSQESCDSEQDVTDGTPPSAKRPKILKPLSRPRPAINSFLKSMSTKKLSNLNTSVQSFIARKNTPQKVSIQEQEKRKRQELEAKESSNVARQNQRQELMHKRTEEMKKKREARMLQVAQRREEQMKREKEMKKGILSKMEQDKHQQREEKMREEAEKLRHQREKKLAEAELRRKQEDQARLLRLQEKEQEARQHNEHLQRKKEYEEQERQKRLAEQHRQEEARRQEAEKEAARERERFRHLEEQRLKEVQERKRAEEERARRDHAERMRQEVEKQKEKERLRQEEQERKKEQERKRLQAEQEAKRTVDKQHKDEKQVLDIIKKHNNALQTNTSVNTAPAKPTTAANTSFTIQSGKSAAVVAAASAPPPKPKHNSDSYDMTPTRTKPKKKVQSHKDNYDINDLQSDDSTDDEDAPRKHLPEWAEGAKLKAALINQYYKPPNLDDIFDTIVPPNLSELFDKERPCFTRRTSSAHWTSPILKPSGLLPK